MAYITPLSATMAQIEAIGVGPQTIASIAAAGVGRQRIRTAVTQGALTVMRRGIVVPAERWRDADLPLRRTWAARAATLAYPGSWVSHDSAARLRTLPDFRMPRDDGDVPLTHITRLGAARRDGWLTIHGWDTSTDHVVEFAGLPTTDLVRTSIEVAAGRSLRGALVVIDAAMRLAAAEDCGPRDVRAAVIDPNVVSALRLRWRGAVGEYAKHRWVTTVRRAVELADPAAESVLESLSRAGMVESDIPAPRCGVPLVGDDGRTYWVDCFWDGVGLIGEADGSGKYGTPGALLAEKHRQEALASRYPFVRWGWEHVYPDPTVMLSRVRHALAVAAATPPTRSGWLI